MTFGLKPLFLNNRFCPMALNKFDILKLAFLKKRKKLSWHWFLIFEKPKKLDQELSQPDIVSAIFLTFYDIHTFTCFH